MPILIARCESLDARNEFGRTALFVAVRTGNKGDVEALLNAGADPDLPDRHGHTPAHVAAIKTGLRTPENADFFASMIDVLAAHGANLEIEDAQGRSVNECLEQFGGRNLKTVASTE